MQALGNRANKNKLKGETVEWWTEMKGAWFSFKKKTYKIFLKKKKKGKGQLYNRMRKTEGSN